MKPIQKILVPTDFSDGATRALEYAIHLAQAAEAQLFILHAYRVPNPVYMSPYPVAGAYGGDTLVDYKQIKQEVEQNFEALVRDHLRDRHVEHELISVCDMPEEAIEETVNDKNIDLTVMGTRGGGVIDKLVGSTTTHVMRRVACPLIAVPENAVFTKVDHILLATDYERIKRADTFQILVTLANIFRAQINILHVTPKYTKLTEKNLAAGDMIDRLLRHAHHTYCHEENDDVLEGLRTYLREHDEAVGMLAMVPRDHNLWDRVTRGSVTKNVLFEADRPVFVVHE
jgi:nucleotide-binding universal stress UspA family protein